MAGGIAVGRRNPQRGATLFTMAVVIFVASVILAVVTPTVQRLRREAVAATVAADLHDFAGAFLTHAQRHGDWPPPTTAAGQAPTGMDAALGRTWTRRTPIGGRYLWAPETLQRGRRYHATIMLCHVAGNPVSGDRRLLEEIDRQIDDGDLSGGNFLLGYRDQPFFVIEP
jgi:type II secretory pathway pseudopilin PulG